MVEIKFFNATWCGPCQTMKPDIKKLIKKGYPIEMVDVDEQPTIAESANVRGVPMTAIYQNGQRVESIVGLQDINHLEKKINVYYEL